MDLVIGFVIFLVGVVVCMVGGYSLSWAMLVGFFCFFLVGCHRGYSPTHLLDMAKQGNKTAFLVLRIILLIGVLTGVWRASGTIAYFVSVGLQLITPKSFLLVAFLLPAILCLACGSSFGSAGTAGVILMTIARTGNANLAMAAGAALSGAYVGERLSPASSVAALVAAVTGTEQQHFHRQMWKDSVVTLGLTTLVYGMLSVLFPIEQVDVEMIRAMEESFVLHWSTVLPAVVLLILPWLRFTAMQAIAVSCVLAALVAVLVQGIDPLELLKICVLGYEEHHPALASILSGGGLLSMSSTVVIVFLSCAYASIFTGTGMLEPIARRVVGLTDRIGRIGANCAVGLCAASTLCNQVGTVVMTDQMLARYYEEQGFSKEELARDMGNTVLVLVGMVPWCIACSVPLAMLGVGAEAIPFAVFLYILPLTAWLRERSEQT